MINFITPSRGGKITKIEKQSVKKDCWPVQVFETSD